MRNDPAGIWISLGSRVNVDGSVVVGEGIVLDEFISGLRVVSD
ncbi:MAG TPA: hypothetical protein VJQ59_07160 [Candidatus Sulfotelmatobacter sp.]|nr:hypothetical protein [Candidatus Sulfotelmatobacter sp.]